MWQLPESHDRVLKTTYRIRSNSIETLLYILNNLITHRHDRIWMNLYSIAEGLHESVMLCFGIHGLHREF